MKLTPRQHEVLKSVQAGHKTSNIASQMRVNQTTVREHINHIKRFYGVESSGDHAYQEAIKRARKRGDP